MYVVLLCTVASALPNLILDVRRCSCVYSIASCIYVWHPSYMQKIKKKTHTPTHNLLFVFYRDYSSGKRKNAFFRSYWFAFVCVCVHVLYSLDR